MLIKPITSSKIKIRIHINQCGLSICSVFFGPKKGGKKSLALTEPNFDFYFAQADAEGPAQAVFQPLTSGIDSSTPHDPD